MESSASLDLHQTSRHVLTIMKSTEVQTLGVL